jgi:hypothetical protein
MKTVKPFGETGVTIGASILSVLTDDGEKGFISLS